MSVASDTRAALRRRASDLTSAVGLLPHEEPFPRWSDILEMIGFVTAALCMFGVGGWRYDVVGWVYTSFTNLPPPPLHRALFAAVCMAVAFLLLSIRRSAKLVGVVKGHQLARIDAESMARHDALTGLPNRRGFLEELERAIARTDRGLAACAVLLIDLDKFKPVNDIHGHAAGDAVLREIAQQLGGVVRKPESLARIGGDEFAVIVEYLVGGDAPARLAKRLIAAASRSVDVGATTVEVGATIGIASCPMDGVEASDLMRSADIALYRAKKEARGDFRCFEQSMEADIRTRAALEADLRRAIAVGEIRPYFQPIIDLRTGALVGFEVLARWHHPTRGVVFPDAFIPVIEETGLSGELTYAILRLACLEAAAWPADLMIAVNVSPSQLQDKWLPQRVLAILTETGFPARRLEIEITENALVAQFEGARNVLASLKALGIRISLDDFGTGYSNLSNLRDLRIDKVKIDKSFVLAMAGDPEAAKIVVAILGLAKSLGLSTTAEGIEDAASLRRITDMGCDFGQGYHFAKALPAAQAAQLCAKQPRQPTEEARGVLLSVPLRLAS